MSTSFENAEKILEAALFSSAEPLPVDKLAQLFPAEHRPSLGDIRTWLLNLKTSYEARGVELVEVASGYRFQIKTEFAPFIQRLEERKPARYTRSFLETLALIAYRQPITRGEIEDVRGVTVNSNVIKTLLERDWIKIAGYRDVPGKPALFATTKAFLDYFNLKSISQLPPLSELIDFETLEKQLGLQLPPMQADVAEPELLANITEPSEIMLTEEA
ncbi:MAG: SMC-Scp complex subunit ScpB [Gammaproteobacteria bacterium CG_4_10_14_0_8_um_filter_38_16]|nr:MAG: SMC-Scp complex subunit ScpB [Gammaproteobacteria bacterium CG_4_10_14_0_8_um_filter_38_16]PJA03076.1 MAG: SMC-Scp complex subunit ScpB [Gammaproteobacteria bacterium CG_4_10_14_0_2_um_filter_38_22]PJB10126.1 MAG: SMC-Scp complex subunit ScpB [Gammaproteobacteria bacterium CG_4_9_14_3_um_filter_38_9]